MPKSYDFIEGTRARPDIGTSFDHDHKWKATAESLIVNYAVCCTYGLFALNRPDAVSIDHGLQDIGLQQITCTYAMELGLQEITCTYAMELFYSANTYTSCSCTGERPTLPNLLTFPVKSGSYINIPQQIGTNYFPFGVLSSKWWNWSWSECNYHTVPRQCSAD